MSLNTCDNLVISCIDFRIQSLISSWIHKKFPNETYDYAAFAGSVKNLTFTEKQIEISKRLHAIQQVILIGHEDCGAYGRKEGVKEIQRQDLHKAATYILKRYPTIDVHLFYLHVSGVFEEIQF